jgi:hypothetical protein
MFPHIALRTPIMSCSDPDHELREGSFESDFSHYVGVTTSPLMVTFDP